MQPIYRDLRSFSQYSPNRASANKCGANNCNKSSENELKVWSALTQLVIMRSNRKVYSAATMNGLHGSE